MSLLAAVVPIVAAAVHVGADGWTPEGETAVLARRTKAVLSSRPPLIGVVSTSDRVFGSEEGNAGAAKVYHPGALEHYLLAVPYAVSGWSPVGLLVGVVLVNAGAAVVAVWLTWRRLGAAGAAAAALAAVAMAQALGTAEVASIWNPSIVVFPVWAALVSVWALLDGDTAGVAPAILFASLAAQSHLASLPIGLAVLAVAVARIVWGAVRDREHRYRWLFAGVVAQATVLVVWLTPLIQQFTGSPGNLGRLGSLVTGDGGGAGGVGLPARVLTGLLTTARLPGADPISVNDSVLWRLDPIEPLRVVIVLLAIGFVGWTAWSRRDRSLGLLLATFGGATVVAFVSLSRVGTDAIPVPDIYLLRWAVGVVPLLWTAALVAVASVARDRLRRSSVDTARAEPFVIAALVAMVVWAVAASLPATGYDRADYARNEALTQGVRRRLPSGSYLVEPKGYAAFTVDASTVALDLEAHGYDIAVPTMSDRRDESLPPEVADGSRPRIVVDTSGEPVPEGARTLYRRTVPQAELTRLAEVADRFAADGVKVEIDKEGVHELVPASPELRDPIDTVIANLDRPEVRRLMPGLVTTTDLKLRDSLLGLMTVTGVPQADLDYLHNFKGTTPLTVWLEPASS